MNYDITFCANKSCPKRQNCERNTDRLKDYPYPVSMALFTPYENSNCEHYVPMRKEYHRGLKMTCKDCVYGEPNNGCGYTLATISDISDAGKRCPNFTPYPFTRNDESEVSND